jgi:hypothetical protein
MVDDCEQELTGMWSQILYINLVGLDESVARKTLLEGINLGRNKPIIAPIFPGTIQHKEADEPHFPGNSVDEARSFSGTLDAVGSGSNIPLISSPNTESVSSENELKSDPTRSMDINTQPQQSNALNVKSNQVPQTTIDTVTPSNSSLPLTEIS